MSAPAKGLLPRATMSTQFETFETCMEFGIAAFAHCCAHDGGRGDGSHDQEHEGERPWVNLVGAHTTLL